jgi:hypothetical protein
MLLLLQSGNLIFPCWEFFLTKSFILQFSRFARYEPKIGQIYLLHILTIENFILQYCGIASRTGVCVSHLRELEHDSIWN